VETAVDTVAIAAAVALPFKGALAESAGAAVAARVEQKAAAKVLEKAYHYTFAEHVDSILRTGLLPGKFGAFVTPNGSLGALGAHIELALEGAGRTAVVEVDLAGLRAAGFEIPSLTRVTSQYGMAGGGYQMVFPYTIPGRFISVPGAR
jgi:hypothetical protein